MFYLLILVVLAALSVLAYNAAANSWPGWGDEGIVIQRRHIDEGIELALCGLRLVKELNLGHVQLGTSQWLVGALHLAGGRTEEAIAALICARDAYGAAGRRAEELMALGYLALARKRVQPQLSELDEICRALQQDGSSQAAAFVQQLRTADRLL
jgi:hypothetical protein